MGTFSMSGTAKISGNTADYQGGGVFVGGSNFTMSGSSIVYGNEVATNLINTAPNGGAALKVNSGSTTYQGYNGTGEHSNDNTIYGVP